MQETSAKRPRSRSEGSSRDAVRTVTPLDPRLRLSLPSFEGPLDLLLHLIEKHELDVRDLPIAFVVERYLDYLRMMEALDLDVASEYLVMAATLAFIKSKMLLPPDPTQAREDVPEEDVDPRAELIRKLLEYQKYKAAAEDLLARGIAGRDVFVRGTEAPEALGPAPLASVGLFRLLDAFREVLARAERALAFEVTAETISIQDRMAQLVDRIRERRACSFEELFDDVRSVADVVVTFLAILEMAKRRLARIHQEDTLAPIRIESLLASEASDAEEGSQPLDDEHDESVAMPGDDPLGEALDPNSSAPQDAPLDAGSRVDSEAHEGESE